MWKYKSKTFSLIEIFQSEASEISIYRGEELKWIRFEMFKMRQEWGSWRSFEVNDKINNFCSYQVLMMDSQ